MNEPVAVRLDARQIKTLAHPLRARLLGQLRLDGPATATRLAEVLDTNTGATSYHLRQLADVGLVVPDERKSRGRERWWRAAHDITSWWASDFEGDPDAMAASTWLHRYSVRRLVERIEQWMAVADDHKEWRDAATVSDYRLYLTPAQLRTLNDELDDVIERHRQAALDHPQPGSDEVVLYLADFPRTEGS